MTLKKIEFGAATALLVLVVYNTFAVARKIISLGTKSGIDRLFIEQNISFNYNTDYAHYYPLPRPGNGHNGIPGLLIFNFVVVLYFYDRRKYVLTGVGALLVLLAAQFIFALAGQQVEAMLPGNQFVRIHRSFIAALNKIDKIERHQIHIKKHILPIGKLYADNLLKTGIINQ